VTEPDPTTDIWNPLWDGTRFEEELIDLPDFEFVGAVTWDRFGNEDTAVWRDTSERAKWYYQDRDHGGPYTGLVAAHREDVLEHLRQRRVGSCDSAARGLSLEVRIRTL
jgi:hypothetical protein